MIKVVTALILSRLDYCNFSFMACLLPLSKTFVAYRTVLLASDWKEKKRKRKTDHIIPLCQFLHWLPIQQKIQYRINTLCYKCITGTAPSYLWLSSTLHAIPYSPLRFWYSQPPDSSHQILHCWFPRLLCFQSINMEWPSPSSPTETLSGLIQM